MHSLEGISSVAMQLNYVTDIALEMKAKLTKIKTEVKELKKLLSVIHLSLINESRHSGKSNLSVTTPFQRKYPFPKPKIQNSFPF